MAETRGVLITVALIGAAGAVIAALIASSGKEPIPGSPGPSQVAPGPIFGSNVAVIIPGSFAQFAPQQFWVIATGHNSIGHDAAPFTITG